jgi:spore coat protein U-like protein
MLLNSALGRCSVKISVAARSVFVSVCFAALIVIQTSKGRAQSSGPQCTFSITNISFGTVDVKNGRPYDATGTFTYACTGDSREIVRICPSLGIPNSGPRFMTDDAGGKLFFNLYSDPSRTTVWGSWYSKNQKAPQIDVPIGRGQRAGGTATIYARLDGSQQSTATGVYSSVIKGGNSAFAYDYASKGSCESPIKGAGARVSVPVSITARVGDGSPASQPLVAPDATHTSDPGSAQVTNPQPEKQSLMQKLVANAQYQQQKQQGGNPSVPSSNRASSGPKPLCKMSDSDVHLVNGTWSGPNCIAVDSDGKPAHAEDAQQNAANDQQARRADYIESHSCLTTDGADKADQLAEDCGKVTGSPHSACNVQQNTCDEIRDATKHGCDGLGASAPDFCMTRYTAPEIAESGCH